MSENDKFYATRKFLDLKVEWDEKLRQSGFIDVEDEKKSIGPHTGNVSTQNSESIRNFFIRLDHFLNGRSKIRSRDRSVLTHYSDGVQLVQISKKEALSLSTVKRIIRKYRSIINI